MRQVFLIRSAAAVAALLALAARAAAAPAQTNRFPSYEVLYSQSNPKIIWGGATNFIRGGYGPDTPPNGSTPVVPIRTSLRGAIDVPGGVIKLVGQPLREERPARLYVENVSGPLFRPASEYKDGSFAPAATNFVRGFLPPLDQRFAMTMIDAAGVPVPKTSEGRALGEPLSLKPHTSSSFAWRRSGLMPFGVFPRDLLQATFTDHPRGIRAEGEINPARYFKMRRPGIYWLTVVQRLYVTDTNMCLIPVCLPPVTVEVRVAAAPPGAGTSRFPVGPLLDALGAIACAAGVLWLYTRFRSRRRSAAGEHLPNMGLC